VEKLEIPLQQTLDLLTYASAEQLWYFEWQTNCPECSGEIQNVNQLQDVKEHVTCNLCLWEGEARLDREISVYATLNSRVRQLDKSLKDAPLFRDRQDARYGRVPALALINRPLFREIKGEQTLPDNGSLGVQHLAVFFSDLRGSTALYQRRGDIAAYRLVREHFTTIFNAVEQNGGSAVKTIGDGVMGTFFTNAAALHGIREMVTAMRELNQRMNLNSADRLQLKIGLHAGTCLVVTLNHRLDYFGSTINMAARLSALAEGDDLIVSASFLEDFEARKAVQDMGLLESMVTTLRGIRDPVQAYRLKFS
jgi:class 3 adenylate cyclase